MSPRPDAESSPALGVPHARDHDPLARLRVIRRLTVGPVKLEPRRLIAPYTIEHAGGTDTTNLIYRYEDAVFAPNEPADQNLAAMIAAQVALNYGLFCDEILLLGAYDAADRRFLADMAENTAREIYVNKLLAPNVFLRGDAVGLPAERLARYCAANIVFDEPEQPAAATPAQPWGRGADRYVVLSSGGKDSLLSYGLLHEIGAEVHPVFVNEAGKHWFTALNAYRHFNAQVPRTGRVWTNADRIFAWMLRRLPFIRDDFADVRADAYPIRLWTVAVFLFGVLPVARHRGVDRLIIGDEFDTTERTTTHGITHYAGLFDQSRFFDDALTRYYASKGWRLYQFSILRPLAEFLIEKTLAERYPDLLRLQVSCHATHKDGDRVRPCGKCEKCRRIVGMLTALGHDPAACGYDAGQVCNCLADLVAHGIHQEREGAEHLAHLLHQNGAISSPQVGKAQAKPQPHVAQLRFDRERSPVTCIPADLRARLFPVLLKHADGAVQKHGRVWRTFNPLAPEALAEAYPFDRKAVAAPPPAVAAEPPSDGAARSDFVLGEMTWPQAEAHFKRVDVALLPVGAIEQHGHHLPLDTDAFDANHLAMEVAKSCQPPRPFVLPLIPYGVSYHHDDFRGTLSVTNETLSRLVYEIGMAAARHGITKLIVINGHGGNAATLHFAAQMINRDAHIFTCVDTGETSDEDIERIAETPGDIHAGEIETSTSLATRGHLVDMRKARKCVPKFSSRYLDFSSKRSVDWYARTVKLSASGVMGDPTKATVEKGRQIWDVMVRNLVELVEHLKGMSLDEIHQRNRF